MLSRLSNDFILIVQLLCSSLPTDIILFDRSQPNSGKILWADLVFSMEFLLTRYPFMQRWSPGIQRFLWTIFGCHLLSTSFDQPLQLIFSTKFLLVEPFCQFFRPNDCVFPLKNILRSKSIVHSCMGIDLSRHSNRSLLIRSCKSTFRASKVLAQVL